METNETTTETTKPELSRVEKINAELTSINIKGKSYVPVNQRILGFRKHYPNGSIETEVISDDGKRCIVKATVKDLDAVIATGHACEEKAGRINTASYVENCETSAVGRALGFLGIGATEAIASAEEMRGAAAQQKAGIKAKCKSCGAVWLYVPNTTDEQIKEAPCRKCGAKELEIVGE